MTRYTIPMTSRIILILIIGVSTLVGISYFTTKIYSTGFRFNGTVTKLTFLTFLMIPLLFVASMVMSRSTASAVGPAMYTVIQIISGMGLYLFFGAIVLGIILTIGALTNTTIPIAISLAIFGLSLAIGITGLIQARIIGVTNYTVTLPNAPELWNGKTAVLVTDTHFGFVNYAKFSDKVINNIIAINPDFVLHAGDFYDGPNIDTTLITSSWKRLTETIPVFYAPGNHEGYGTYSTFIQSARDANVVVLEDSMVMYDGVQISGITYRDGKENPEAAKAINSIGFDPTQASILINHPPTSLDAIDKNGVGLMVSGHTHNGQFWPGNYLTRAIYGVYTYGLHEYKSAQVLTSRGVGTFGPPFRTFNQAELVLITFKTK